VLLSSTNRTAPVGAQRSRISNRARGSGSSPLLLAIFLILVVAATTFIFVARLYPAPPPISRDAVLVDRQYNLTLYVTGVVFLLAQLSLAYVVVRFRDRGQKARFVRGNVGLEILWTSLTLFVFVALGVLGRQAWADVRFTPPASGAIRVEGTTSQFVYAFRYPGKDGKFGRLDPRFVNAPAGNPLGIDPSDPAGRDDVVVSELIVPAERPVELLLRSEDVVHNFFVRELRLQQDAMPGLVIAVHFTADHIGDYEIVCTQLCGLGHYKMHSLLRVVSQSEFEAFLNRQATAP